MTQVFAVPARQEFSKSAGLASKTRMEVASIPPLGFDAFAVRGVVTPHPDDRMILPRTIMQRIIHWRSAFCCVRSPRV